MKVALSTFILGLIFGAGVALFVTQESEAVDSATAQKSLSTRAETAPENRRPRGSSVTVGDCQNQNSDTFKTQLDKLTSEESIEVISALLEVADPLGGIEYSDRRTVSEILSRLARTDFARFVQVIMRKFPEKTGRQLVKELVLQCTADDFSKAIAFVEQYDQNKFREGIIGELLTIGIEKGHEEAIKVLSILPVVKGAKIHRYGSSQTFPADFDFQAFGEAASRIASEVKDRGSFANFPSDFLKEWTRRSPDEAMAFYNEYLSDQPSGFLPFSDLGNLAEGYLSNVDASKGGSWLGATLGTTELTPEDKKDLLSSVGKTGNRRALIINELVGSQNVSTFPPRCLPGY